MGDNYWTDRWLKRKHSRRQVVRAAALGGAGLWLAGCATSPATPTNAPAPPTTGAAPAAATAARPAATPTVAARQPKLGGSLKPIGVGTVRNLEPHNGAFAGIGAWGPHFCYNRLVTFKWGPDVTAPSYAPVGDLAESWTQPDELTYVFKLRPGVKWHNIAPVNGRELVADDVIYSYERVRELRNYAGSLAGITRMEATDKSTLRLTLERPNADLLSGLASIDVQIVARERVEQTGGSLENPPVIGTGPFVFESMDISGGRFVARRNPDYFIRGQPYAEAVEAFFGVDPSTMINAFRSGNANLIPTSLNVQQADELKKVMPQANVIYIPADRSNTELMLNMTPDTFRDVRVRQAISKALDRKAMIDAVWLGRGSLTAALSLPDTSYSLSDSELGQLLNRDLEGARRLLREAGKDTGLSFEILAPTYLSGAMVSMAELAQANLREIGIATTLKSADTATYTTAIQSGNYQAAIQAGAGGNAPNIWLPTRFTTTGAQNWAKYSDADMDRLIGQQAIAVRDPEARKRLLQDIQRKIINDAVYIPILRYNAPVAAAPEIQDFYPPLGLAFHNAVYNTVWLDK